MDVALTQELGVEVSDAEGEAVEALLTTGPGQSLDGYTVAQVVRVIFRALRERPISVSEKKAAK